MCTRMEGCMKKGKAKNVKTAKDPIRKKNGKIRLHALTLEEDLKFRGPLSYR